MISPAVRCVLGLAILGLGASHALAANRRYSQKVTGGGRSVFMLTMFV